MGSPSNSRWPMGAAVRKYVVRHRRRGKMLTRERVELLIDADTAFPELCPFAA